MGKSSKAPAAPDPEKTAAAQTASNKETAYWNAVLNNVNQITPYGNLTYTQTGGGKQYNMDAYNKALSNYNSSISSGAQPQQFFKTAIEAEKAYGPGNITYSKNGGGYTYRGTPAGGNTKYAGSAPKLEDFLTGDTPPQFTSTINLSPEQQKLLDTQQRSDNALALLGEEQIGRIRDNVSSPYSYEGLPDAFTAEDAATASQRGEQAILSRLDPQFSRDEEALRTRLINQGIGQGSEAYNTEFERFNQAKNDARMQAILQGSNYGGSLQSQALQRRNQGIQEYNAQRNAPLNEYTALTSGQQVQNPQFQSGNYQGANPVDYTGLVNNQYQQQLANYNANTAGGNSLMSGLFGLGGSALSGFAGSTAGSAAIASLFSDKRLKRNIRKVGKTLKGFNLYEYNFIGSTKKFIGVLAQEVERIFPQAVQIHPSGFKTVNYEMVI